MRIQHTIPFYMHKMTLSYEVTKKSNIHSLVTIYLLE